MKKKTVRKIIYLLVIFPAAVFAFGLVYMNFIIKVDTAEVDRYYGILQKNAETSGSPVFKLDVSEGESLQSITDRLKTAMGLDGYRIWTGYGYTGEKPAFVTTISPGVVTITFSKNVSQKREQINVLIHELSHIYVWSLDKSLLEGCDEEKFTDCAGVFLGLGIPMLNGLTDEIFFMPGGEYQSEKKMFGYIRPEQLGYLTARYCGEHGIRHGKAISFLGPAGRKYFNIGYNHLKRASE